MKVLMKLLVVLVFSLYVTGIRSQSIAINEVMASNFSTIADEDGDYEDWIELYNYGTEPINLYSYGLSDSYNKPYKWVFPEITIQPGEFLLIFASSKNRTDPAHQLHTNYGISADGEEIILTDPNGVLVDELLPTPLLSDISYGRSPDGIGTWFFFNEPTPGFPNHTQTFNEVLDPPIFSHMGGFYNEPFELNITHNDPDVTIVYTLDGSIPDTTCFPGCNYEFKNSYPQEPGQPFGPFLLNTYQSHLYNSVIPIYDRSEEQEKISQISSTWHFNPTYFPSIKQKKGIPVRARAFKSGAIASVINTNTYFLFNSGENPYTLPLISISIQEDALFDYYNGIYVAGLDFDNWRINNPNITASIHSPGNYSRKGVEWEYPAHFEFLPAQEEITALSLRMGLRLHGKSTKTAPVKSLRLYARSGYGSEYFNYPFFGDNQDNSFKRILLRNSGNDYNQTLFRDAFYQSCVKHLNFDTQDYEPSILFINGIYWGIHNIRERFDKHYLARVYGIDPENIDLLEINGTPVEGNDIHYNSMRNYIKNNSMADPVHYQYITTQMDIENFMDYQIAEIFGRNTDWPGNNIKYWRLRTNEYQPQAPKGHDGRWRWLMYDTDFVFGISGGADAYTHNTLEFATAPGGTGWPNPDWSTFLLRNLLINQEFQQNFINRFADLINTTFRSDRLINMITQMKERLQPEMAQHINRWESPPTIRYWNSKIDIMIDFAQQRPFYQRQHIREHFDIESDIDVTLDVSNTEAGYIRINTINITPDTPGVPEDTYPWTGIYFHNIPIEIEAIAEPGFVFSHWTGSINSDDAVLQLTPTGNIELTAHFIEQQAPGSEIIHYWHFNTLNGTVVSVQTDYSAITPGIITYPGTGAGYMDERTHRTQDPVSNLNLLMGQLPDQGAVLRVRNPSDTRNLIITSPTTGFEGISLIFAIMRTSNGAQSQELYLSPDAGDSWTFIDSYNVPEQPGWILKTFDLNSFPEANDNPDLQFKIIFTGSNASNTSGNDRFDNMSVHGTPTTQPLAYFSKPTGDLSMLSSWGSEPDGSGSSPESFSNNNISWFIHNRTVTNLDNDWNVNGSGSKVIAGDGINAMTLTVNAWLNGLLDVSTGTTLVLKNEQQPVLGELSSGSTVKFMNNATIIPYKEFSNIIISGIDPEFSENGTITVKGNLNLEGDVVMPDARGAAQYSIVFNGTGDQLIDTDGNVLRSYNMNFEKEDGNISFAIGSIISTDNQLTFYFTNEAKLNDNGILMYAGNSVNIGGNPDAYDFSGTLILAGTEEGIVNGSGSGNNFNIRETKDINNNAVAPLNNLIIRVANTGGEFRLRDGTTNDFTVKGNLIVESGATGRIRFYNNDISIGGNFIVEEGFAGTIDATKSIRLNGVDQQLIELSKTLNTQKLIIDNPAGVQMDAITNISSELIFMNGILNLSENSMVKMGLNALTTGFDTDKYINGQFAIKTNNEQRLELFFPVGTTSLYAPFIFEPEHGNTNETEYIGRAVDFDPMGYVLDEELGSLIENNLYQLSFSGNPDILESKIKILFNEEAAKLNPGLLRIAKFENDMWISLGGLVEGNKICSTEEFTLPGVFALAKAKTELPETLLLQGLTFGNTTDTCFAATKTIILAGNGTSFIVENEAMVNIVAGENIIFNPEVQINHGAMFHAWIDTTNEYCGQEKSIIAVNNNDREPTTSIKNKGDDARLFNVYPNPTNGNLTIVSLSGNESCFLEVYNFTGEKLLGRNISGSGNYTLNLSDCPEGMYLLRLFAGSNFEIIKIVKL
jgi:hypothetical protein